MDLIFQSAPILKIICDRNIAEYEENTEKIRTETNIDIRNNDRTIKSDESSNNYDDCDNDKNDDGKDYDKVQESLEEQKLLDLMESRLQYILKSLVKRCSSSSRLILSFIFAYCVFVFIVKNWQQKR